MVRVRLQPTLRWFVWAAALPACVAEYPGADLVPILGATDEEAADIREALHTLDGVADDLEIPLRQIRVLDEDHHHWRRGGRTTFGSYNSRSALMKLRRSDDRGEFNATIWHEFGHAVDSQRRGDRWSEHPFWSWRNAPDEAPDLPNSASERVASLIGRGPGLLGIALPLIDSRSDCDNSVLNELRWLADKGVRPPLLARGMEDAALWTLDWPRGWRQTEPAINDEGRWFFGGSCPDQTDGWCGLFATGNDLAAGPDAVTSDARSGDGWSSVWDNAVDHPLFDGPVERLATLPDGRDLMMERLNFPEDNDDAELYVVFTSDPATGELSTVDSLCYRVGEGRYPPVIAAQPGGTVLMIFDERRATAHGWGRDAPTAPPVQYGLEVTRRKDGTLDGELVRSQ